MNNRYIFRGKRVDNGEWVEGNLLVLDCDEYRIATSCLQGDDENLLNVCAYEVIPETVGQCTSLKDKNGKLIFEGDVVNALFDFGMPIKSVCGLKNESFGLLAKQHGVEHFHAFTSICNVKYEVIGNIYDNDLLEVER